jgi:hypothetical protein
MQGSPNYGEFDAQESCLIYKKANTGNKVFNL